MTAHRPTRFRHPSRASTAPAGLCLSLAMALSGCAATRPPSTAPPSTDIFLVSVDRDGDTAALGGATRVTEGPGYDNQPSFLDDGTLVFSSMGGGGHTDIRRFDPATGATSTVVSTPQSEYSPTPVPGAAAISVVRDYGGGDQQLWRFPLDPAGGEPELLLPDVNPVGYHAWIDELRLLLFVLGESATLRIATLGPGPGRVVAQSPGRCLARIPAIVARAPSETSFVRKLDEDEWWLEALDPESGATRRLVRLPAGREDYAWSPDGAVWLGDGSRLLRWRPDEETWAEIADLSARGIAGITRLAFDRGGTRLALVADASSRAPSRP